MRILVTGGSGFLGRNLVPQLLADGHGVAFPPSIALDFLNESPAQLAYELSSYKYDAIIHLAGVVGGIGFNQNNQGKLGFENLQIGLNILELARKLNVAKLIMLGTTCSYPHSPKTIPFVEEELFDGMPEITNSGYGIVKRTIVKLGIEYAKQYGMNIVNLIPTNMYGEFDHFEESKSHVIPAIIKKFENPEIDNTGEKLGISPCRGLPYKYVNIWGNGSASRDFLYVGDCVSAIITALNKDIGPDPINLGMGREVTIKELVNTIQAVGSYSDTRVIWELTKPNGQPRRSLNCERAKRLLGWEATTSLGDGLRKTIDWYRNK